MFSLCPTPVIVFLSNGKDYAEPISSSVSYPSSLPWYTEAGGEAVVLKQIAFASWKANTTEGNLSSFHKARNKCVYPEESHEATIFQP